MAASRDVMALAERLPVVVFESDAAGALTFLSERWVELTGLPLSEGLGSRWRERVDVNDQPLLTAALRDATTHRVPIDLDVRLSAAHGRRTVRVLAAPMVRGPAVVGHAGLLVDVTAAREHLAALEERENRLQLLEARSQALLEAVPDLVFQLDAEGRFVDFHASAAAVGVVLLPPERFIGRALEDILPTPVAMQARAMLAQARASGTSRRFEYQLDLGTLGQRDFEARISPMRSGGSLAVVRDVTDLKRAERELIAARERAMHASSSKSQFLANVSHEIRTPLNGIIGVTQLLRTMTLPAEVTDYLQVLEAAGEALLGLVNEVLDLSKIEAQRLELERASFDLEALVGQVTRGLAAEAQRKRLALSLDVDPAVTGQVTGDAGRVRQIVTNLVANAIKFTDEGAVQVVVRRRSDGDVVISVKDTGRGIPPGVRDAVFEPFVQAGAQRGGTGLGLSISRSLARLMGGDVELVTSSAEGTTFEARLPLAPSSATARPARPRVGSRRLKVLLAEDNEVNARLTRAMLEWLGHEVETVGDGRAAVERSEQGGYDVVFMDVQMPLLDGLEATRRIRERERGGPTRLAIVALTANAMKGDELACLSAGMDAYLPKPVTVEALSDVLVWFSA
ncbi:MAG: ATP-binding protein [Myxococcaceae bacterium]|nr:ATP-binding protein [Myxococcaceae bacterium]